MEYDDFSLPQSFEKMAQEYHKTLKDKGFVFYRLDENEKAKQQKAQDCVKALSIVLHSYQLLQRKVRLPQLNKTLNKVIDLTELQIKKLNKMFGLESEVFKASTSNIYTLASQTVSQEASALKSLLNLCKEEDGENKIVLKSMLDDRLTILEEN